MKQETDRLLRLIKMTPHENETRDNAIISRSLVTYPGTHLFQTTRGSGLPMPIVAVDGSLMAWGLATPPAGLPPTILVGGDVWRFTGLDEDGNAQYAGYYPDQGVVIGTAGSDGTRGVNFSDAGTTRTGIFKDGVFTLQGGNRLLAGDTAGARENTSGIGLQTVATDLDIMGNFLTLGSWTPDLGYAGLTMEYTEHFHFPGSATYAPIRHGLVGMTGGRAHTSFLWNHTVADGSLQPVPMMLLASGDHSLSLYAPTNPTLPAIVFNPDPAVGSRVNGPLRVAPAGDLGMGDFTSGPKPDGSN